MKYFLTLTSLQIKRALYKMPVFIVGTILLCCMAAGIAFCSMKLYDSATSTGILNHPLNIDLVVLDDSSYTAKILQYIKNLEASKNTISYQIVNETKAYEDLRQNKAVAVFILPHGLMDSILDGTNQPITIVLPKSSGLSALIIKELSHSGAILLDSAQADIYALTDLYLENDLQAFLTESYDALNEANLSTALSRNQLFQIQNTKRLQVNSTFLYYLASSLNILFFLFAILCSSFLERPNLAFLSKLFENKFPFTKYTLARLCATFIIYLFFTIFINGICLLFTKESLFMFHNLQTLCNILIFLFFISTYTVMMYSLVRSTSTGILLTTISAMCMLFLSGVFIPTVFFPPILQNVSTLLPTTYTQNYLLSICVKEKYPKAPDILLLYSFLFLLISILHTHRCIRKDIS